MTLGMIVGVACLVVFAFIVGNKIGQVLAQLDALSEYAEVIHNNLVTLIDMLRTPVPEEEENSEES